MATEEIRKEAENIRFHVNNMIDKTFKILAEIYKKNQEGKTDTAQVIRGSRLIFSQYRTKEDIHISEQELRFAFVEVFNRYCTLEGLLWFYSIETPTMQKYRFSENKKDIYPKIAQNGQSANFDFVIHDHKLKRICLIEFKALNSDWHEHHKDFFKLQKDHITENNALDPHYQPYTQHYFIEMLAGYDNETCANLAIKKINLNDQIKLDETQRKVGQEIADNIINYKNPIPNPYIPKIRFCCFALNLNNGDTDGNITDKIIPPHPYEHHHS